MKQYDVFLGNTVIGYVNVEAAGLYTTFQCKCKFQKDGLYRITAHYDAEKINIGVCIPDGDAYTASAKVPSKLLNCSIPRFYATPEAQKKAFFQPIFPESEFDYICQLPCGKFRSFGDQKGIVFGE